MLFVKDAIVIVSIITLLLLSCQQQECNGLAAPQQSRRTWIKQTIAVAGGLPFLTLSSPSVAAQQDETNALTVPKGKAVVVLGANGGTGQECCKALLRKKSRPCIATTRSGTLSWDAGVLENNLSLTTAKVDVTDFSDLSNLFVQKGSSIGAVVFAASVSAKGGDASAFDVDRDGLIQTAKACIAHKIPRLVIVSSGTVTRPDSAVYKLLNFVGKGIMEAKIQGEDAVRELYVSDQTAVSNKLGYTVIRPGGLTPPIDDGDMMENSMITPSVLELNQGDDKSGRLSRTSVAELCVECLDSAASWDTTFECYDANTAKPVESVGFSNILKKTDGTTYVSGRECRGKTWEELFMGLERDGGAPAL